MKKGRILNSDLNELIGILAHGDLIFVSDAGMAIPQDIRRVDLAIERDLPDITTVLELINSELNIEKVAIAEEQKIYNSPLYNDILDIYKDTLIDIELVPYEKLKEEYLPKARAVVRTGAFSPWGSVVLFPGIDAAKWYEKDGLIVPDMYKKRVNGSKR